VIGLGTQDDFPFATRFVEGGGLQTPVMLWDPSFLTWQALGVTSNSQMMVLAADLGSGTNLIYGFNDDQRAGILELVSNL